MHRLPDGWKAERIDAVTARAIDQGWRAAIAENGAKAEDLSVVEVPSLRMTFLGRRQGSAMTMRALNDVPQAQLQTGTTLDAAELLERLVPLAIAAALPAK